MLIRRLTLENVRSFRNRATLLTEGPISIIIGPNGGGKTNLLDSLMIMLRRYLFSTPYASESRFADGSVKWTMQQNDLLNNLVFEKNSQAISAPQTVEIELEITQSDLENMQEIKLRSRDISLRTGKEFFPDPWVGVESWNLDTIRAGQRVKFTWQNSSLIPQESAAASLFLNYLHLFEFDNNMRAELRLEVLRVPMLYLSVNRIGTSFDSTITLASYDETNIKRSYDAGSSRTASNIMQLAIGRLAKSYRLMQETSNIEAKVEFYKSEQMQKLSLTLASLGYTWELVSTNPMNNSYDVLLTKQGSSFLTRSASSGEKELLTYLFAIYALNIRDALILIDEPELHLHPRWQVTLLRLFEQLSSETNNQFVMATHSPTFVSPESISYVSRVYSSNQISDIVKPDVSALPQSKHLFNIVNSEKNERIFFSDFVVLVEGLSDRIVFERLFQHFSRTEESKPAPIIEIVSVGGKGLFDAYAKLLNAFEVKYAIVADLDYMEQIGSESIKSFFVTDSKSIKRDVIDNRTSLDGASLVKVIDNAIRNNSWSQASEVWEYIKARQLRLQPDLTDEQQKILMAEIASCRDSQIYVLSQGVLEDYLPEGYKGKDIEKLISLVSSEEFLEKMPSKTLEELEAIVGSILNRAS